MAEKIIMLACSAGMSTSMLVAKMQEEAKPDVLMLGPQVAYMKADVQKKCDDAGVPMEVINMTDYGMMNGKNVLDEAEKIMG